MSAVAEFPHRAVAKCYAARLGSVQTVRCLEAVSYHRHHFVDQSVAAETEWSDSSTYYVRPRCHLPHSDDVDHEAGQVTAA